MLSTRNSWRARIACYRRQELNRTADDWDCLPKMDGMELSLLESSHMWLHQAEIEIESTATLM